MNEKDKNKVCQFCEKFGTKPDYIQWGMCGTNPLIVEANAAVDKAKGLVQAVYEVRRLAIASLPKPEYTTKYHQDKLNPNAFTLSQTPTKETLRIRKEFLKEWGELSGTVETKRSVLYTYVPSASILVVSHGGWLILKGPNKNSFDNPTIPCTQEEYEQLKQGIIPESMK